MSRAFLGDERTRAKRARHGLDGHLRLRQLVAVGVDSRARHRGDADRPDGAGRGAAGPARPARGRHPRHPAVRRVRRGRRRPGPARRAVVVDPHHGALRHRGRGAGTAPVRPAGARERGDPHRDRGSGVAPAARVAAAERSDGPSSGTGTTTSRCSASSAPASSRPWTSTTCSSGSPTVVRRGLDASWVRVSVLGADGEVAAVPAVAGDVVGDAVATQDLVRGDERLGRLELGPRRRGEYDVAELALLGTVARQATTTVANVRLTARLERAARRARRLARPAHHGAGRGAATHRAQPARRHPAERGRPDRQPRAGPTAAPARRAAAARARGAPGPGARDAHRPARARARHPPAGPHRPGPRGGGGVADLALPDPGRRHGRRGGAGGTVRPRRRGGRVLHRARGARQRRQALRGQLCPGDPLGRRRPAARRGRRRRVGVRSVVGRGSTRGADEHPRPGRRDRRAPHRGRGARGRHAPRGRPPDVGLAGRAARRRRPQAPERRRRRHPASGRPARRRRRDRRLAGAGPRRSGSARA